MSEEKSEKKSSKGMLGEYSARGQDALCTIPFPGLEGATAGLMPAYADAYTQGLANDRRKHGNRKDGQVAPSKLSELLPPLFARAVFVSMTGIDLGTLPEETDKERLESLPQHFHQFYDAPKASANGELKLKSSAPRWVDRVTAEIWVRTTKFEAKQTTKTVVFTIDESNGEIRDTLQNRENLMMVFPQAMDDLAAIASDRATFNEEEREDHQGN